MKTPLTLFGQKLEKTTKSLGRSATDSKGPGLESQDSFALLSIRTFRVLFAFVAWIGTCPNEKRSPLYHKKVPVVVRVTVPSEYRLEDQPNTIVTFATV